MCPKAEPSPQLHCVKGYKEKALHYLYLFRKSFVLYYFIYKIYITQIYIREALHCLE